jgi:hypothetical protein
MTSWRDVEALCARLPGASRGVAHEGSPAYFVGRHPFARLRWSEDGREILQSWSADMDTDAALAHRRDVFPVVHTFTYRVSIWAYLDALTERETAEMVLDSYVTRGPVSRRGLDVTRYLP